MKKKLLSGLVACLLTPMFALTWNGLFDNTTNSVGTYTAQLPAVIGHVLVGDNTIAATMGTWTAAAWNHYSGTYLPIATGSSGATYYTDAARVAVRLSAAGSTSTGYSYIYLGNNIATGSDKNCLGGIILYTTNTGNVQLMGSYGKLDGTNNVEYLNVNQAM